MATKTLQTAIIFDGIDRASKVIRKIQGNVAGLQKTLTATTGRISNMSAGIQATGQRIGNLGMSFAPASLLSGLAVKGVMDSYIDLERQMVEIGALTGQAFNTEPIKKLQDEITATADITPFSPTEIAKGANELARAGNSLEFIQKNLRPIMRGAGLVKASMTAGGYSDAVTNILAGSNLESTTANITRINDMLAKSALSVNATASQMTDAFKTGAPVAAAFGMELEQIGGFMMALAQGGFKGAEGGKSLRTIMLRLAAPTKKAREALSALGIDLTKFQKAAAEPITITGVDAALDSAGFSGVAENVQTQIASILNNTSLDAEDRVDAAIDRLREAGGEFDAQAESSLRQALNRRMADAAGMDIQALLKQLSELRAAGKLTEGQMNELFGKNRFAQGVVLLDKYDDAIEYQRLLKEEAKGATEELNKQFSKSLFRRIEQMTSRFQALQTTLGKSQGGAFGEAIDTVSASIAKFNSYLKDNDSVAGGLMIAMTGFAALAPGLWMFGGAMQGLAMALKPFQLLAALPFKAMAAGLGLVRVALGAFTGGLKGLFAFARMAAIFSGVGVAAGALGAVAYALVDDWSRVKEAFGKHLPESMRYFGAALDAFLTGRDWKTVWTALSIGLDELSKGFSEAFGPSLKQASAQLSEWFSAFPDFEKVLGGLGDAFKGVWDTLTGLDFSGAGGGFEKTLKAVGNALLGFQTWAIEGVTIAITALDDILKKFVESYNQGGLIAGLGASFEEIGAKFRSLFTDMEGGVVAFDRVSSSMDKIRESAVKLWNELPSFGFDVETPDGEMTGLQKVGKAIKGALDASTVALIEAFAAALESLATGMNNVTAALKAFKNESGMAAFKEAFSDGKWLDTTSFAALAGSLALLASKYTFPALRALPALIGAIGPFKLMALAFAVGELTESLTGLSGMDWASIAAGGLALKSLYSGMKKLSGLDAKGKKGGKGTGKGKSKTKVETPDSSKLRQAFRWLTSKLRALGGMIAAPFKYLASVVAWFGGALKAMFTGAGAAIKFLGSMSNWAAGALKSGFGIIFSTATRLGAALWGLLAGAIGAVTFNPTVGKAGDEWLNENAPGWLADLLTWKPFGGGEEASAAPMAEKQRRITSNIAPGKVVQQSMFPSDHMPDNVVNLQQCLAEKASAQQVGVRGPGLALPPMPEAPKAPEAPKIDLPAAPIIPANDNLRVDFPLPPLPEWAQNLPTNFGGDQGETPQAREPRELEFKPIGEVTTRDQALLTAVQGLDVRLGAIESNTSSTASNTGRTADSISGLGAQIAANMRGMTTNRASNAPGSPQRAAVSSNGLSGAHL